MAFTGSGGVWAMKGGDFQATNFPGTGAGVIAACAYAGSGGRVFIGPGTYTLTSAIIIASGLSLEGAGRDSTILNQTSGSADVLSLGTIDANNRGFNISNLTLSGGRYGLRLNNIQDSKFTNLKASNNTTGIYTEGQIETCSFNKLRLEGFSGYGVSCGNLNSGSNPSFNFPIIQKCSFRDIETGGSATSTAIKITAGIYLAVQQVSLSLSIDGMVVQGNEDRALDISRTTNIRIARVSNERATLSAANTYTVIALGAGSGNVTIHDSFLATRANDGTTYKYVVDHQDGQLLLHNVFMNGGGAGTADINIGGRSATIMFCVVTNTTTGIVFNPANKKEATLLVNVLDNTSLPVSTWDPTYPFAAAGPLGIRFGNAYVAGNLYTGTGTRYQDASGNEFMDGIHDEVIPNSAGKRWRLRRDGDNLNLLDVFSSPPAVNTGSGVSLSIGTGTAITKHISATATLDYDLSAVVSQDLTITVTGAAVGDSVAIGVPNGSVTADTAFFGWVSATNTVTIRAYRLAGAPNPASGTFRADVWQH